MRSLDALQYQIPHHVLQALPAGAPEKSVDFLFAAIKQTLFKCIRGISSLKLFFWIFCFVESSTFNQFHHGLSYLRRLYKTQIAKLTSHFLCTPFATQVCKISLHFQTKGIICPVVTYPSYPTAKSQIFQLPPTLPRASTSNTSAQSLCSHCRAKQRESGFQKTPCMLGRARRVQNRCSPHHKVFPSRWNGAVVLAGNTCPSYFIFPNDQS